MDFCVKEDSCLQILFVRIVCRENWWQTRKSTLLHKYLCKRRTCNPRKNKNAQALSKNSFMTSVPQIGFALFLKKSERSRMRPENVFM